MRINATDARLALGLDPAAAPGRTGARAAARNAQFDTVTLSGASGLLSRSPLLLPTMKNAQALSAALGKDLNAALRQAGISTRPPVDIRVDNATGRIRVSGDRPDAPQIEELLNGGGALAGQIRNTLAIASHAVAIERGVALHALRLDGSGIDLLTG